MESHLDPAGTAVVPGPRTAGDVPSLQSVPTATAVGTDGRP